MAVNKKSGDFIGFIMSLNHRGPATRVWCGMSIVGAASIGTENAPENWVGGYVDAPSSTDWMKVTFTSLDARWYAVPGKKDVHVAVFEGIAGGSLGQPPTGARRLLHVYDRGVYYFS